MVLLPHTLKSRYAAELTSSLDEEAVIVEFDGSRGNANLIATQIRGQDVDHVIAFGGA